jgi:hypothetical protein
MESFVDSSPDHCPEDDDAMRDAKRNSAAEFAYKKTLYVEAVLEVLESRPALEPICLDLRGGMAVPKLLP